MSVTLNLDQQAAMHLALAPGFGPQAYGKLAGFCPSPQAMLAADADQVAQVLTAKALAGWHAARAAQKGGGGAALRRAAGLVDHGAVLLWRGGPGWPARLHGLKDAPVVLMATGAAALEALQRPTVAVVGSRTPSEQGRKVAGDVARALARNGATVVSGAAVGVDEAAHRGAMDAGGKTVAVLGTVLGESEGNVTLRQQMVEHGGSITEMVPGSEQHAGSFPQRNRLISALSGAVVVVQGKAGSGARHTAEFAQAQGRPLFAVPGPWDEPASALPHQLIAQGKATLLMDLAEVLRAAGMKPHAVATALPGPVPEPVARMPSPDSPYRGLWDALGNGALAVDALAEAAGLPSQQVTRLLLAMELDGLCQREAGGAYARR